MDSEELEIQSALLGFPSRLRLAIGEMTPNAFALKCGMSDGLLRAYLAGSSYPGLEKLLVLAKNGGVSVGWLAAGRDPVSEAELENSTLMRDAVAYTTEWSDFIRVPHFDVRASAGLGRENSSEPISYFNSYRKDWWQRNISIKHERCFTIEIRGDSMSPRLTDADRPIIDRGDNEVLNEGIYVFRLDGQVFIKYLERVPGKGLVARSENPRYQPWDIGDGSQHSEFKVIGRAIYKETGERL